MINNKSGAEPRNAIKAALSCISLNDKDLQNALNRLASGFFNVVAWNNDKPEAPYSNVGTWRGFHTQSTAEIFKEKLNQLQIIAKNNDANCISVITGKQFDDCYLYAFDVDINHNATPDVDNSKQADYLKQILDAVVKLSYFQNIYIEATKSGGLHFFFKSKTPVKYHDEINKIYGVDIAADGTPIAPPEAAEKKHITLQFSDDKKANGINKAGCIDVEYFSGNLVAVAPSNMYMKDGTRGRYRALYNDIAEIDYLNDDQIFDFISLFETADVSLFGLTRPEPAVPEYKANDEINSITIKDNDVNSIPNSKGNINSFNAATSADLIAWLQSLGYKPTFSFSDRLFMLRPGKERGSCSVSVLLNRPVFYVFSTNTEFNSDKSYNLATAWLLKNKGGYLPKSRAEWHAVLNDFEKDFPRLKESSAAYNKTQFREILKENKLNAKEQRKLKANKKQGTTGVNDPKNEVSATPAAAELQSSTITESTVTDVSTPEPSAVKLIDDDKDKAPTPATPEPSNVFDMQTGKPLQVADVKEKKKSSDEIKAEKFAEAFCFTDDNIQQYDANDKPIPYMIVNDFVKYRQAKESGEISLYTDKICLERIFEKIGVVTDPAADFGLNEKFNNMIDNDIESSRRTPRVFITSNKNLDKSVKVSANRKITIDEIGNDKDPFQKAYSILADEFLCKAPKNKLFPYVCYLKAGSSYMQLTRYDILNTYKIFVKSAGVLKDSSMIADIAADGYGINADTDIYEVNANDTAFFYKNGVRFWSKPGTYAKEYDGRLYSYDELMTAPGDPLFGKYIRTADIIKYKGLSLNFETISKEKAFFGNLKLMTVLSNMYRNNITEKRLDANNFFSRMLMDGKYLSMTNDSSTPGVITNDSSSVITSEMTGGHGKSQHDDFLGKHLGRHYRRLEGLRNDSIRDRFFKEFLLESYYTLVVVDDPQSFKIALNSMFQDINSDTVATNSKNVKGFLTAHAPTFSFNTNEVPSITDGRIRRRVVYIQVGGYYYFNSSDDANYILNDTVPFYLKSSQKWSLSDCLEYENLCCYLTDAYYKTCKDDTLLKHCSNVANVELSAMQNIPGALQTPIKDLLTPLMTFSSGYGKDFYGNITDKRNSNIYYKSDLIAKLKENKAAETYKEGLLGQYIEAAIKALGIQLQTDKQGNNQIPVKDTDTNKTRRAYKVIADAVAYDGKISPLKAALIPFADELFCGIDKEKYNIIYQTESNAPENSKPAVADDVSATPENDTLTAKQMTTPTAPAPQTNRKMVANTVAYAPDTSTPQAPPVINYGTGIDTQSTASRKILNFNATPERNAPPLIQTELSADDKLKAELCFKALQAARHGK